MEVRHTPCVMHALLAAPDPSRSSAMVDFSTLGQSITTCFRMMLGYIDVYAPM